ncbi:META domain-containing protein [Gordonia sp. L191]|uniref:META domain-containing protein n=1 Tax=Gordonia sp. L191 TaxID=2982699 RepID=UPI0024C0281B|nr:META domain-containing protein [Gordonia sp. L191]WHU49239.1 META domain-containing protein [Gordonia sp. L191]
MVFPWSRRSTVSGTVAMSAILAVVAAAVAITVLREPDSAPGDPAAPQALPAGASFTSVSVSGAAIPGGGPLVIAFGDVGRISMSAGCNRHVGGAALHTGSAPGTEPITTLRVGALASTMMACPPPREGANAWLSHFTGHPLVWHLDTTALTLTAPASADTPETVVVLARDHP